MSLNVASFKRIDGSETLARISDKVLPYEPRCLVVVNLRCLETFFTKAVSLFLNWLITGSTGNDFSTENYIILLDCYYDFPSYSADWRSFPLLKVKEKSSSLPLPYTFSFHAFHYSRHSGQKFIFKRRFYLFHLKSCTNSFLMRKVQVRKRRFTDINFFFFSCWNLIVFKVNKIDASKRNMHMLLP